MSELSSPGSSGKGSGWVRARHSLVAIRNAITEMLQTITELVQSSLDLAEFTTISIVCDGSEQIVYEKTGVDFSYFFGGGFCDFTGANAGAGEDTVIKCYNKPDGTNYRVFYEELFLLDSVPNPASVPYPRSVDTQASPDEHYWKQDIKVTVQQLAVGGGWNTLDFRTMDSRRGS